MGILDLAADTASTGIQRPLDVVPATPGERFEAEFSAAFAPDRYFTREGALRDRAERVISDIQAATGERLPNPYGDVTAEEMMRLGNQPAVSAERLQKLRERATSLKAMTPEEGALPTDYLDTDFEKQIARDATVRRQRASELHGTGAGWAGFLGSMAGESLSPHGLAGFLIPVTKAPTAASIAIGETFLANVAKETAFQAGANIALQAGAEGLDYAARRESGTEQTAGEVALNIAGAGVFGGIIGGGARALHLKWLGLPESVRAAAPTEVKDAFRVIEGEALYAGGNRFGLPPDVHRRMIERSVEDIMRGKPVQASDIWGGSDTAMTALGRVLRNRPEEIQANITGLWDRLDTVGRLPDDQLEAFARQLKPRSFMAYDRLNQEIGAARGELAAMNRNLEAVTAADMVDPLTGARLADIDARLEARALSARERDQLIRERDMIIQSVDTTGTLAKDLERERLAMESDAERTQRRRLEDKIDKAEAELKVQRGEVQREVEFLREKLTRLKTRFSNRTPSADEVAAEVGMPTTQKLERVVERTTAEAPPAIEPRERLPEVPSQAQEPPTNPGFTQKVKEEAERVWDDKTIMGKTHRGVKRNEDFARDVARERVMKSENPNDVAILVQKNDLTDAQVSQIARLYDRRVGERPQDAFARAFNRWSEGEEREAMQFYNQLQDVLEWDPLKEYQRGPLGDMYDRFYARGEEPPFDPIAWQQVGEQRAADYLADPNVKVDDPEIQKALDLETQRLITDSQRSANLKSAMRELNEADLELKDAAVASSCANGGGAL